MPVNPNNPNLPGGPNVFTPNVGAAPGAGTPGTYTEYNISNTGTNYYQIEGVAFYPGASATAYLTQPDVTTIGAYSGLVLTQIGSSGGGSSVYVTGGTLTTSQGTVTYSGSAPSHSTTIAAANTYQTLFNANEIVHGAYIQNPATNAATLYVDFTGATGTTLQSTSEALAPGASIAIGASYSNAITVFSSSTITFVAGKY
jgi:hypothetical protein